MGTTARSKLRRWKVSLHGGHSGEFCDHAEGTLREILDAAVAFGYHTFGVSEHVPRVEDRFLYSEEVTRGWTVAKITDDFERYRHALTALAHEYEDRIEILRGFECEVVPKDRYIDLMGAHREYRLTDGTRAFDYCVGSVHYVEEKVVDGSPAKFSATVQHFGGVEALAVRYYETVGEMVAALRPEVVGHFDLIKKNVTLAGLDVSELLTDRVVVAAMDALDVVRETGAILDLNTAGWRKGLGDPYPAPWLVKAAHAKGIGFCFGDDSHRTSEVGAGVEDAAEYLKRNGVNTVAVLTREGSIDTGAIVRRVVPLNAAR